MRQLKGKVKETAAQKKERKKEFRENRANWKIAVAVLGGIGLIVFSIVYMTTSRQRAF